MLSPPNTEKMEKIEPRHISAMAPSPSQAGGGHGITVERLNAYYGQRRVITELSIELRANHVTALIGPSGSGKSTVVRCINRMHEEIPGARVEGSIRLDGVDVYDRRVDVTAVREQVERSLRAVGLWDEVKDRLNQAGTSLSGGQQQRLCIARAIAVEPEVILMDEPCSALDPLATLRIEELISELKDRFTIAIVTHNMQQAARVADSIAFLLDGRLIEHGPTAQIFTNPRDERTEQYVTGKFG